MLNKIQITNFKKQTDFTATFSDGSNIIIGENAAGKSTIFDAIRFALYGVKAVTANKNYLPTWGKKDCEVILWVDNFKICRTLKNCSITSETGALLAEGHTACSEYVSKELGMDSKAFSIFAMSQQGETQALLTLGATELNRRVESYAGVDIIDGVIKLVSYDRGRINDYLDSRPFHDITEDVTSKELREAALQGSETEIISLVTQMNSTHDYIEQSRHLIKSQTEHNQRVNSAKDTAKLLGESVSTLKNDLEFASKELEEQQFVCEALEIIDSTTLEKKRFEIENARDVLIERERLVYQIQAVSQDVDRLKELVNREVIAIERMPDLKDKIALHDRDVQLRSRAVAQSEQEIEALKSMLDNQICPTCNREFEGFNSSEVIDKIKKIQLDLNEDSIHLADITHELAKFNKQLAQYEVDVVGHKDIYKTKQDELNSMVVSLDCNLLITVPDIEALTLDVEKISNAIQVVESASQYRDHLCQQGIELIDRMNRAKSELADTKEFASQPLFDVDELINDQATNQNHFNSLANSKSELMANSARLRAEIAQLSKEVKTKEIENAEYSIKSARHNKLTKLLEMLRSKRQSFMSNIWNGITAASSAFVNNATDGWVSALGRDSSGNFTFSEHGGEHVPIIGGASGAQKGFLGVAIRLGLTQALLGNHSMLLLDEPTEAMSEENAGHLASALLMLGGQTLFITHRNSESITAQQIIKI